jgi:cephalosporin hydroxylase
VSVLADYESRCDTPSDICAHLPRLHAEASRQGVKVIELGVRSGNSTAAFLSAAESHDGHVWSVDLVGASFPASFNATGRWTFVCGDDLDPFIVDSLPNGVDVLFIDTSHHYEHTLAELRLYVPKVAPGGVVLMHDTELERPFDAPPDDRPFPVAAAIREFAGESGVTVEWVGGCYGLGVLYVPKEMK